MNRGLIPIALVLLVITAAGCKKDNSFDAQFEKAAKVIAERGTWPDSPEKVCEAFWNARYEKDYSEMHTLWPGSAALDWPEICAKDGDVKYVFGTARIFTSDNRNEPFEEAEVPYASQDHFAEHNDYNLTMRLRALDTQRGVRWYVYSGN
jgi:hypothetical protein